MTVEYRACYTTAKVSHIHCQYCFHLLCTISLSPLSSAALKCIMMLYGTYSSLGFLSGGCFTLSIWTLVVQIMTKNCCLHHMSALTCHSFNQYFIHILLMFHASIFSQFITTEFPMHCHVSCLNTYTYLIFTYLDWIWNYVLILYIYSASFMALWMEVSVGPDWLSQKKCVGWNVAMMWNVALNFFAKAFVVPRGCIMLTFVIFQRHHKVVICGFIIKT